MKLIILFFVLLLSFSCTSNKNIYIEGKKIYLKEFKMDAIEVSVEEFEKCVAIGQCSKNNFNDYNIDKRCNFGSSRKNHPMNCINFSGANEYCKWVGKRLPSEAEWEYAAKGGEKYIYAGSNNPDEVGWYKENSNGETHQIATKKPNEYGLYDMSGNVSEWTTGFWWEDDVSLRVSRGGSFLFDDIQINYRGSESSIGLYPPYGFRCVKDLK